jgi:hypothetical protein
MTSSDWVKILQLLVAAIVGSGVTLGYQAINRAIEERKGRTASVWIRYRVGFLVYLAILGTSYSAYQVTNESAENARVRGVLVCQAGLNQQFIRDALARSQVAGQDREAVDLALKAVQEDLAKPGGPNVTELYQDLQIYFDQRDKNDANRPSYTFDTSCSNKEGG